MTDDKPLWAAMTFGCRRQFGELKISGFVFHVQAASEYEAEGKALAIARQQFPESEGWDRVQARVCGQDVVIEPDDESDARQFEARR